MSRQLPPWRILLVEDNLGDISLLRLALKDAGLYVELTVLYDGEEALAFAKRQGKYADVPCPDLVVLDMGLPKCQGIEVLETIYASGHFQNVPTVVTTGIAASHDQKKLAALGIERQIIKPLDLKEYLKIGIVLKDILEAKSRRNFKVSGV